MNTKFTMSLQTLGALVAVVASGIGGYYMLLQEIEEAKNYQNHHRLNLFSMMSIHLNQMVITGLVLLNNTKHKLVDYKKIWMMCLISLMSMKKRLKN